MNEARSMEGDGDTIHRPGPAPGTDPPLDFIRTIVAADRAAGKHDGRVGTRFPPEPNGFLHVGHAKSIVLNFGVAAENGGTCNLRYDDTNPAKEETLYVESIAADVRWLGYHWEGPRKFASDYFDRLYEFAETLIRRGRAYVDSLSAEEVRATRGTLETPGTESPYRNRTVEENLDLFRRMRAGEFPDGTHVLRARIDMSSGNLNLRDPTLYRIRRLRHHRTGDDWCIYPMYDFAHALSDSIEGITHSLCTLEFEDHRPLYDWCVAESRAEFVPRQIEFARLNVSYTVLSKRRLLRLVSEGHVSGWDDPRMPTIAGLRRRGVPPAAIRTFCERVGVAKRDSTVDIALLEHAVREELNRTSPRLMGVLDPVRLVVENYPENAEDTLDAVNNPEDPAAGARQVPFSRELLIERADFMEDPAAEVLPALPRARSAAPLCVPGDLHGVHERRGRPGSGGPLPARSRKPRGRRSRRAARARHAPLGFGPACGPGDGAPLRPALPRRASGTGRGLSQGPESRLDAGEQRRAHRTVRPGPESRRPHPIGAARLLRGRLRGPPAGESGPEPDGEPPGHLGPDRKTRRSAGLWPASRGSAKPAPMTTPLAGERATHSHGG